MNKPKTNSDLMRSAGKAVFGEFDDKWQRKFASALGISPIHMSDLLSGKRTIQPAHMAKAAEVIRAYRESQRRRMDELAALEAEITGTLT
jgi:transcriptional regulator with XRE-family HTH domain